MKLIAAVSFAFIYKYFSTFLTFSIVNYENFVSEDWFNTTAINNEFKIEYCTRIISNFSSRKRAIPTFRSTKWSIGELFGIAHHLPDHVTSRARWGEKLKTGHTVFHKTCLCAFKTDRIAPKNFHTKWNTSYVILNLQTDTYKDSYSV